jgi:hypothetical protein
MAVSTSTREEDAADRLDGGGGIALDGADLGLDILHGLGGLFRQLLPLRRDDGEAFAGCSGAGGPDGGVERQQVGGRRFA